MPYASNPKRRVVLKRRRPVKPRRTVRIVKTRNKVTKIVRDNNVLRYIHVTETKYIAPDCSRLPDGIFQGARPVYPPFYADAVINLEDSVKAIVLPDHLFAYIHLPIKDSATELPTLNWLDQVVKVIISWRKQNWRILIHCKAGLSRSSLVSTAYLMKTRNLSVATALSLLKKHRPTAKPNAGFIGLLKEYEQFLTANS